MTFVVTLKSKNSRTSVGSVGCRETSEDFEIPSSKQGRNRLPHQLQELHEMTRNVLHEDGTMSHISRLLMLTPLRYVCEDGTLPFRVSWLKMWLGWRQFPPLKLSRGGSCCRFHYGGCRARSKFSSLHKRALPTPVEIKQADRHFEDIVYCTLPAGWEQLLVGPSTAVLLRDVLHEWRLPVFFHSHTGTSAVLNVSTRCFRLFTLRSRTVIMCFPRRTMFTTLVTWHGCLSRHRIRGNWVRPLQQPRKRDGPQPRANCRVNSRRLFSPDKKHGWKWKGILGSFAASTVDAKLSDVINLRPSEFLLVTVSLLHHDTLVTFKEERTITAHADRDM